MQAPWLHLHIALAWPGLLGPPAPAAGDWLCQGGCPTVGTGSQWDFGVLVPLCWGVQHLLQHHGDSALFLLV